MEKTREIAIEICELFEDILDRHGIDIYELEDAITDMVGKAMEEKQAENEEVER